MTKKIEQICEFVCVSACEQVIELASKRGGTCKWWCAYFYFDGLWPMILPCDETALDRAKSILFATIMTGRVRIKSKSCSDAHSCSTRVYDALSTHEYTKMNASDLIYSSYECQQ